MNGGPRLRLPRLGFGSASQGGLYRPVSEAQAQAVFQAAWDVGWRYFDTAPWYGFGQAEERLGRFLRGRTGWHLSSKVGRLLGDDGDCHPSQFGPDGEPRFRTETLRRVRYDYSYDGVLRSHEDSLRRLGTERIDVLLIHDPDVVGVTTRELMDGAYRALHELRAQGVISAIGVGMNQWRQPLELVTAGDFDAVLLAGRYTLLEQGAAPLLDACLRRGVQVIAAGVYNSGLLVEPEPGAPYDYQPAPAEPLRRAQELRASCQALGVDLTAAALQFPFTHPAVGTVLTSAHTPEQVRQNAAAAGTELPPQFWTRLLGPLAHAPATPPASPLGGS